MDCVDCGVESVQFDAGSVEWRVRSVEFGGCGLRSVECA